MLAKIRQVLGIVPIPHELPHPLEKHAKHYRTIHNLLHLSYLYLAFRESHLEAVMCGILCAYSLASVLFGEFEA